MSLFEQWKIVAGSRRAGRQEPSTATPPTLRAELENPQLNRPIVFEPALKQFSKAHRAGEPRFNSEEEHSRWYLIRTTVLHHIVASVSNSRWRQSLLLRGSAVMASWFGDRARRPGDLDWVVMPETTTLHQKESEQLIAGVIGLFDGATIDDDIMIPQRAFVMEAIWTYEKAPGVRIIVPWRQSNLRYSGTVQMDFVFGEVMPTAPVTTDVKIGGFPPVRLLTASREQSLAWKLLWLASDSYAMGKDLYDAVILAEGVPISAETLRATFLTDIHYGARLLKSFGREQILKWRIEWDDFIKEYPGIGGSVDQWKQRLADALRPLFTELPAT